MNRERYTQVYRTYRAARKHEQWGIVHAMEQKYTYLRASLPPSEQGMFRTDGAASRVGWRLTVMKKFKRVHSDFSQRYQHQSRDDTLVDIVHYGEVWRWVIMHRVNPIRWVCVRFGPECDTWIDTVMDAYGAYNRFLTTTPQTL